MTEIDNRPRPIFGMKAAKVALGLALVSFAAGAASADGERYAAKSYSPAPAATYDSAPNYASWSGLYIGMGIGARMSDIDWTTTDVIRESTGVSAIRFPDSSTKRDYNSTGVQFNTFLGYNIQMNGVVVGLEGTLSGAGETTSKVDQVFPGAAKLFTPNAIGNEFDTIKASSGVGGSIRGRLGVLIRPTMLLYGTAGIAFQQYGFHADCNGGPFDSNSSLCVQINHTKQTVTKTGWTLGAGLEAQLTAHWFARIDYSYAAFGDADLTFKFADNTGRSLNFASTMKAIVDLDIQTVNVGVAYKF